MLLLMLCSMLISGMLQSAVWMLRIFVSCLSIVLTKQATTSSAATLGLRVSQP
jgi:hypothetical protein